jgi:hypothetical protein
MNEKLIILISNVSLFFKFLIEKKNIGNERIKPRTKA